MKEFVVWILVQCGMAESTRDMDSIARPSADAAEQEFQARVAKSYRRDGWRVLKATLVAPDGSERVLVDCLA